MELHYQFHSISQSIFIILNHVSTVCQRVDIIEGRLTSSIVKVSIVQSFRSLDHW